MSETANILFGTKRHITVSPPLEMLKQESHEFEASLSYTERLCPQNLRKGLYELVCVSVHVRTYM